MQTPTPKTSRRYELVGPLVAGRREIQHDRQKPVRTERSGHPDPLLTSFDDHSATTVQLDDDVLAAVRLEAARSGRSEDQVVEAAVRRCIGPGVLDRLAARNRLDEDEAMAIATEEVAAHRQERRSGRRLLVEVVLDVNVLVSAVLTERSPERRVVALMRSRTSVKSLKVGHPPAEEDAEGSPSRPPGGRPGPDTPPSLVGARSHSLHG